jgi:C_GCAxxG_C_C family probable redox protein
MNRPEAAAEIMRGGFNCAQSVVKAFLTDLEAGEDAVTRMAAPFGGGLGRCGYVCGALSGATFVIGARFGNIDPADSAARERANAAVGQLLERFRREHGSVMCRDLIGVDMGNAEALQRARQEGVFSTKCPVFVESAGRILEEILTGK